MIEEITQKNERVELLKQRIKEREKLSDEDLILILESSDDELFETLRSVSNDITKEIYKDEVYIRGLIEFSNYCKEDCFYCGIGYSNKNVKRFRLTKEEILSCADEGYDLGFRTFVLQGGEDIYFTDEKFVEIIKSIKSKYSDTRITLSLGVKEKESLIKFKEAGADRYLLRFETSDPILFSKLHPANQSLERRVRMIKDLKEVGFTTGTGFLIGAPYQKVSNIVKDLRLLEELQPEMVGVGPFIPQDDTIFKGFAQGDLKLSLKIVSLIRYLMPYTLIPSTTALNTIHENGRIYGISHGANVIMPNLSPKHAKENYKLYNKKAYNSLEAASHIEKLNKELSKIDRRIVVDKGDPKFR